LLLEIMERELGWKNLLREASVKIGFGTCLFIGFVGGAALARTASGQAAGPGVASQASASSVSAVDLKFFSAAAEGGLSEVALGRMAATKGSNADVKAFGEHMVGDHTKVNASLKALAARKGVTLPSDVGADNRKLAESLSKLSGNAFDQAYMKAMVKDHVEDVAEFEKQSTAANDADLRAFAAKNLPTLKHHLEMARAFTAPSQAGGN
jgi:putative membrane protein